MAGLGSALAGHRRLVCRHLAQAQAEPPYPKPAWLVQWIEPALVSWSRVGLAGFGLFLSALNWSMFATGAAVLAPLTYVIFLAMIGIDRQANRPVK